MRTLNLGKIPMCIRLVLFLLLVVQGVESNPGPTSAASGTGTPAGRGSNVDANRRSSVGGRGNVSNTGRGSDRGHNVRRRGNSRGNSSVVQDRSPPPSQCLRSSQRDNQRSINEWFGHPRDVDELPIDNESVHSDDTIHSLDLNIDSADIRSVILDTHKTVTGLNQKFDKVQKDIDGLKISNDGLKRENKELNEKLTKLTDHVLNLEEKVGESERRNENLEAQSRRENLLFYGLGEQVNETWDMSENKVRQYLADHLNLDETKISIERAHRLGKGGGAHPVIVKFSHFKDKDKILQSYREKKKAERDSGPTVDDDSPQQHRVIRVSEDFTARVRNIRSKLVPYISTFKSEDKRAFLRYDKLIVDGVVYSYDFSSKNIVPDP